MAPLVQASVVIVAVAIVLVVVGGVLSIFSNRVRTFLINRALRPIYHVLREESAGEDRRQQDRTSRQTQIREAIKDLTQGIFGYAPGDGLLHHEAAIRYEHAAATLRLECPDAASQIDALLQFTHSADWWHFDHNDELRKLLNAVTDTASKELREP